jgi:hypothetical protein
LRNNRGEVELSAWRPQPVAAAVRSVFAGYPQQRPENRQVDTARLPVLTASSPAALVRLASVHQDCLDVVVSGMAHGHPFRPCFRGNFRQECVTHFPCCFMKAALPVRFTSRDSIIAGMPSFSEFCIYGIGIDLWPRNWWWWAIRNLMPSSCLVKGYGGKRSPACRYRDQHLAPRNKVCLDIAEEFLFG